MLTLTSMATQSRPPTGASKKDGPAGGPHRNGGGNARPVGSAPSTNASSQTYLLFLGTLLFVAITGNLLVAHRVADPHGVHTRAMRQFERTHLGGLQKERHEEKRRRRAGAGGGGGTAGGEGGATGATGAGAARRPREGGGGVPHWQERPLHDLAGLNCADHGGPAAGAEEMVYWKDIPSDAAFRSPIGGVGGGERKYLTFEPDGESERPARASPVAHCYANSRVPRSPARRPRPTPRLVRGRLQ